MDNNNKVNLTTIPLILQNNQTATNLNNVNNNTNNNNNNLNIRNGILSAAPVCIYFTFHFSTQD